MDEHFEANTKSSFFDDAISNESKKEKESEIKNNKNEHIKIETKVNEININNEMESTIIINYKKRKTTNLDDTYYSLKLPKFLDVSSDIKKKKKKKNKEQEQEQEQEQNEMEYFNENNNSIISWSFDEEIYNKIKFEKNLKDKKNIDNLFLINNNNLKDNNNNKDYIENVVNVNVNEKNVSVCNETGNNLDKRENENKVFSNVNEADINETIRIKNKDENFNSFSSKLNNTDAMQKQYSTDEESNFNDSMSDITNSDDLYERYEIENSDIISVSSNESNENMKDLCSNLKYLDTNSFIVEYEDGKFIFFINQKPYILEEDNEINYLIESTEHNIKPIHCKLEKKFFIKSIATEEQIIPTNLKLKKEDIYYSLDDININEEIKK